MSHSSNRKLIGGEFRPLTHPVLLILAVVALARAYIHWSQERREQNTLRAVMSPNGFLPVPMPQGAIHNKVIVFAPVNCPHDGAQRAAVLANKLTERGILNVRMTHYASQTFEPNPEIEAGFKRLNAVMTGELPIVLINGMGKANPSIEQVVSEYKRTQ